jgi:hypothetical protein
VATLRVVPEFPESITLSGTVRGVPVIIKEESSCRIFIPKARQAFIDDRVSLEISGSLIRDSPSDRAARKTAL